MTQATHRRRVLIVEDEPALRLSYDRAFRPRYDLAFASNGAEAMEQLEQHRPEVAVLDMRLPDTDGIELLRFLADEGYRDPVLIISGFDRRVLESAYRLGEALGLQMVGPLEKPARLEELEAILNQVRSSLVP